MLHHGHWESLPQGKFMHSDVILVLASACYDAYCVPHTLVPIEHPGEVDDGIVAFQITILAHRRHHFSPKKVHHGSVQGASIDFIIIWGWVLGTSNP
jgi:hypothetical protein